MIADSRRARSLLWRLVMMSLRRSRTVSSLVFVGFASIASCAHPPPAELAFRGPLVEPRGDGTVEIREDSLEFIGVEDVGNDDVATLVRAPGHVSFREGAVSEVGPPVEGRVTGVSVRVGQRVRAGDLLLTIASPSAAAVRGELARARILASAAELEVGRQETMQERGIGVDVDLVRARAELAQARSLERALGASAGSIGRGAAASVEVRAPIAGTVLARRATVGLAVEAGGDPLVAIGEPGALRVVADVFERELALIEPGASARVSVASVTEPITARVESIGGAVDDGTRRAPVYLTLDADDTPALRAGMYARAEIEIGRGGLGIPTSAVLVKDGGRTLVYVERGPRNFAPRDVAIGAPVDGRVPILAGLEPNERVVVRGALLLDGQAELVR